MRVLSPIVIVAALTTGQAATSEVWQTGLTHSVDGRFGVVYERDRATGRSSLSPLAEARYTATWRMQADNGWRVAVSVGLEAGNIRQARPAADPFRN